VPVQIMAGYSVMAHEIIAQLDGRIPSHFFIPAGCGGLAGGMLAYFWQVWKEQLPSVIIVESEYSDCVLQSMQAKQIELVNIVDETVMAGLSCGEVSRLVWPLLSKGVQHVISIPDEGVVPMMRCLAKPDQTTRAAIEGGECSAASLIALMAASGDKELKSAIGLTDQSVVLVLGTEGATDPEFYHNAVHVD
jgi:diaminopropionate ammonia-lyase